MADEPRTPALPSLESLLTDLRRLALRDPDRIGERLAGLRLRDQAELVLRLPPRERLEVLLHAPKPMRLVRALPDFDFYITLREVGPVDALPLVALASATQLVHVVDLESWRRDTFDPRRSGGWVALFLEAGESALQRFLRQADDELLVLLLQKWARVEPLPSADTPDKHGAGETEAGTEEGMLAPDGFHRFRPLVAEHGPAIRRILEILFLEQPERYRQLLWSAQWELPLEVEEMAHHWRQSRLEEHGFPPWEEALEIYRPPKGLRAHPEPLAPEDPDALAVPRTALRQLDRRAVVAAGFDALDDAARERALFELTALANRVLVADTADTGDPEAHRRALSKAAGYVSIALEVRGARTPEGAAAVLREVPLLELFREGHEQAVALQARLHRLRRTGWASRHPRALELLDAPLRPALMGLLQPRPLYFDARAREGEAAFRDFRSMAEIEETRAALALAEILGRILVERLGLDLARALAEAERRPFGLHFSAVFLTALAWHATGGRLACEPLPPEVTAQFLRTVASQRTADPGAPARCLEAFLETLQRELEFEVHERATLAAFGRACLEKLREECGSLDPGRPVEARFVSCLLLREA